ncbi:MAG: AMP-binding protein, partial [Rhodospirillales bacterium]|nr:AMP-binding protein [Rhodospirillales bacterium]
MPTAIDDRIHGTLVDLFQTSRETYAGNRLIESFGVGLTYRQVGVVADAVTVWLQGQGLGAGDRVAVMMPNVAAYMPVVFGILQAGCTVVNVNPLYTPNELAHQLRDSGAKTIFVIAQFEHTVKAATADVPVDRVVRVKLGDLLGFKGHLVTYVGGKKTPVKKDGQIPGAVAFADVVRTGRGGRPR